MSSSPIQAALTLFRNGDPRGALTMVSEACERSGESASLLTLMGELHATLGEVDAAHTCLCRAARLTPLDAGAWRRLAGAQFAAGLWNEAVDSYRHALDLEPRNARALNNLGQAYERLGATQQALDCYRRALSIDVSYAPAHGNLGNVLAGRHQLEEALQCYRQALALRPDLVEAWVGQAKTLIRLQQPAAALTCCDEAVALNPRFAEAWFVRAEALENMERSADALRCCNEALSLRPQQKHVLFARANLLRGMGETAAAVNGFRQALQLDPEYHAARIATAIAQIPALPARGVDLTKSGHDYAAGLAEIAFHWRGRQDIDASACVGVVQPFYLAYQERNQRELLAAHGALCSDLMARWQVREGLTAPSSRRASPRSRRRIAIVSAQIAGHSVYNAITRGWITRLDRKRFEVDVYHIGSVRDALTEEARLAADHFVAGLPTIGEWCRAITERSPDVLLYPEVGMNQWAMQLAAMRLAPVQAVAWGHPVTSGLPTMDYYLSAEAFEPADGADHYTERLLRLPNLGVYCEPAMSGEPDRPAEADRRAANRSQLANGAVFVCAGTPFKYAPEHDAVLVEIARRVGACQFHFFTYRDGSLSHRLMSRLHAAFHAAGLDGARHLVLHPWLPAAEFGEFLRGADLFLDTLGFSGFNTVLQALECALPVVSHRGRFMRGRLGSGLLERLNLRDLVADTPREFVDKVVSLASDARSIATVRGQMRAHISKVYRDDAPITALQDFLAAAR